MFATSFIRTAASAFAALLLTTTCLYAAASPVSVPAAVRIA